MSTEHNRIRAILDLMEENWPEASADQAGTAIAAQRLGRLLQRTAQDRLRDLGLTFTEFELLSALRAQVPPHRLTPSDLYGAMLISSGGLTKVLKGLEARGLVRRPPAAGDGRSHPVELTVAGCTAAERAMREVQAAELPAMRAMACVWRGDAGLSDMFVELARAAESARDEAGADLHALEGASK